MRRLSLSHLTVLDVGPPELITLAADAGFSSVGIRLHSPMPGGAAYPIARVPSTALRGCAILRRRRASASISSS